MVQNCNKIICLINTCLRFHKFLYCKFLKFPVNQNLIKPHPTSCHHPLINYLEHGGGMKGSSSETFLTRVAEPPPPPVGAPPSQQPLQEDFGLANGLNDLSNVVRLFFSLSYLQLCYLLSYFLRPRLDMIKVALVIGFSNHERKFENYKKWLYLNLCFSLGIRSLMFKREQNPVFFECQD